MPLSENFGEGGRVGERLADVFLLEARDSGSIQVAMMMEVYAHVLPTMQADAAAMLGGLLHGR